MDPTLALTQLGGVASVDALRRLTSAKRIRTAVRNKSIRRIGYGRYALPDADKALTMAAKFRGMASHASAAQVHGWEIAFTSPLPSITVPRKRTVADRRGAYVYWADLGEESGLVTSPMRTVIDCARRLSFAQGLAIADSALRHGDVDGEHLIEVARHVRGKGAAGARRVARHSSGLAANPFESVLRAIALDAGLRVSPQRPIPIAGIVVHPDLVDERLRLAIEADSWRWHAGKEAHERDCWRYTMLVVNGWTVLRFTWEQVMLNPDFVRACLISWKATGGKRDAKDLV